jgi:plastocyanin
MRRFAIMCVRPTFFLAVVALTAMTAACSSSYASPSSPSQPTAGSSMSVSIVRGASGLTSAAFTPNPDTIAVGDAVVWTNNDSTAHATTADDGSWNSAAIEPGAAFSRTFTTAGTYTYHCSIHPGMIGTVTVR